MATSMIGSGKGSRAANRAEGGFSLLEVVISMAILTVGMVSLLGVFGLAMSSTLTSQQDMIAKELANEALESIITARNTSQINWDAIQNVGSTNCSAGSPGLVRSLHGYCWRGLTPHPRASSASARRLPDEDRSPHARPRSRSPSFRSRSVHTCQGLRPRRTGKRARVGARPRFAFRS